MWGMNTAKTLLTATGIGLILGGVYFGLGEIPMPNPSAGSTSSLQASSGQAPSVQVSKTIPDAVTSLETIPTNITPRVESLTSFKKETVTTENLTQRFVQEIGEKLAQKNPVGPELIQGQNWFNAPDPTTLANELIAEMSSKFSFNDLKPIITKNDIIISDTATKEAIAIYAARVETILEKAGNKIPENILVAPEQRTAEDLALLVRIYGETIKDFYA
ncbi:MAG: hypothetical protein Q8R26_03515, partial [bacterium]|nr:hypothetical protein [bacterium]